MAKRIVVINDDTTFLTLMQELLTDYGYEAHICKEGTESHETVRAIDPDCMILDIRLDSPETGWLVLEVLKLDPLLTKKPVIICSADIALIQERMAYLKSKGCEVLFKPFDLDDLLGLLRQLIGEPRAE